jgi:type IV secretion system protein VirD4
MMIPESGELVAPSKMGQFRVRWLVITLQALWGIGVAVTALALVFDVTILILMQTRVNPRGLSPADIIFLQYGASIASTHIFFTLWTGIALGTSWHFWKTRLVRKLDRREIIIFSLAALGFLGFPWSFLWAPFLGIIPYTWWLLWPLTFGILPCLFLVLAGWSTLALLYLAITGFIFSFVVAPLWVYLQVFKITNSLFLVRAQHPVFLRQVAEFWDWFRGIERPRAELPPDDSKGARFATPGEVTAALDPGGVTFGYLGDAPLSLDVKKHVLIMASTRSGKGVSLIIPHLLRYPGSAFVLDPKGENAKATGRRRGELNQAVHYLDPFGISGKPRSRFNPLARIHDGNLVTASAELANALVFSNQDDFWTNSARQLLSTLIMHVCTSPDVPSRDLPTVRLLLNGDLKATLQKQVMANEAAEGLISLRASSFALMPENTLGSIVSTAFEQTVILDDPHIIRCLAAYGDDPEVDFAQWHRDTMTVYLCLSAPKFPVFNRWLRLVLTSALDDMTDTFNPPPRPVCFLLDELATLGHLAAVENASGLAAGYGVQLWSVFQDIGQAKDLYKARWTSFVGNSTRCLFSLQDYDTADYFSKMLGMRLVESVTQATNNWGQVQGRSVAENVRPLLSPESIMEDFASDKGKILLLAEGLKPIIGERVPYYQDPSLDGLWDNPL